MQVIGALSRKNLPQIHCYAAGAAAFSYQAAEDLPFRVFLEDLKLAKMPATPQFFMKSLGGEYYPVTVLEAKAGENSILCKVQQKVPPGSYALFFQKKDRLFQLRKTLRILAPVIQQITIDHSKVADGNMVVLDGLYLGRQRKALPIARGDLQGAPPRRAANQPPWQDQRPGGDSPPGRPGHGLPPSRNNRLPAHPSSEH